MSFTSPTYNYSCFWKSHSPNPLKLTDIVDDLGDVGDEPVVARAVAVLPGVPGQVALQLGEEGIHQALLPTLAVVALVIPYAAAEASLARIVWNTQT